MLSLSLFFFLLFLFHAHPKYLHLPGQTRQDQPAPHSPSSIQHQRAYPSPIAHLPAGTRSPGGLTPRASPRTPPYLWLLRPFLACSPRSRLDNTLRARVENNACFAIYTCSALHRSFIRRIASRVSRHLCDRILIGSSLPAAPSAYTPGGTARYCYSHRIRWLHRLQSTVAKRINNTSVPYTSRAPSGKLSPADPRCDLDPNHPNLSTALAKHA